MGTEIYYFTGTGNSLYVARDITNCLGGELIPIASLTEEKSIGSDADCIGIVFPVYYLELPVIIKRFAEKLENIEGKYIFAVCTYGGAAGASLRMLKKIIISRGGRLSAAYGVHMPQNSFYKSRENRQKIFNKWKRKLSKIINNTNNRVKGMFYSNVLLEFVLISFHRILIRPACKLSLVELTKASSDLSSDELMHLTGKAFYINDKCTGCGICSHVCPVCNIIMTGKKPVWQDNCESCLACYNWCPHGAIEGGITQKDYYYLHPDIEVTDIMKQKDG